MSLYEWLLGSVRRAWQHYRTFPLLFAAPVFFAGAANRLATFLLHHLLHGKHWFLDAAVLVLFSFPLDLLGGLVCARLYLVRREGHTVSGSDLFRMLHSREVLQLIVRLLPRIMFWLVCAGIPAFLLALLPRMWRAFVLGMQHPGVKPARVAHHSSWVSLILWLLIAAALLSRYTFVIPLFVTGRFSAREAMRSGVKLVQESLLPVLLVSLVSVALGFGFGHPVRQLETGSWMRRLTVALVVLVESSAVYSLSAVIGAELAFTKWDLENPAA